MDVQDLIGAAYDAVLEPGSWGNVLAASCQMFASEMAAVRVFDRDGAETLMIAHGASLTPELYQQYRSDWSVRDVHNRNALLKKELWNRPIYSERDIVSAEEERRDPYVQEFLLPAGLCSAIGTIGMADGAMATVAMFRAPDASLATTRELRDGAMLFPHLIRAARMTNKQPALAGADLFEHVAHAVLLLDARGRLSWLNGAAEALFKAGALRLSVSGILSCGKASILVEELVKAACLREHGGSPRFAVHRHEERLFIVRGRVIGSRTWPAIVYHRASILVECFDAALSPSTAERLQRLFGLTAAEAAVALLLSEDMNHQEIAATRGVSVETVRGQSKAIMRKVGVSRRSALIRLIAKISD